MNKAFTLAEVLLTLTIVGTIAALTIPSLMFATQQAENKAALKNFYSIITQASYSVSENQWTIVPDISTSSNNMRDAYASVLSVMKSGFTKDLFPPVYKIYKSTNTQDFSADTFPALQLVNGVLIIFKSDNAGIPMGAETAYMGDIYVDINGVKPPNEWGTDMFLFSMELQVKSSMIKVIPAGTANGGFTCEVNGSPGDSNYEGCTYNMLYDIPMP